MSGIRCAVDCRNALGEGPLWCPVGQVLWWIDISAPSLWRLNPGNGAVDHWPLPRPAGSFALRKDGGFFFLFRKGPATLARPGDEVCWVDAPGLKLGDDRFNDGKCDRAGRFWSGTLDRRITRPLGALYRFESPAQCTAMDHGFTISNGIGWSPDNKTMYFTDTTALRIYAYDYDLATGSIANRRVFAAVSAGHGGPDGMTVDAEGFVWSAQFDRWCINRYAPDGRLERSLRVPVQKPTSVTFGGPNFETLYVTSATMDLNSGERAAQPYAGGLFAIEPGVKGLAEPRFAG